jgi:nitrite reductase (NADH) small subunit
MSVRMTEESHHVGQIEDFPDGGCRILELDGESIGIYRRGRDFYALRNVCPHMFAPLCRGTVGGTMLPSAPNEFTYGLDGYVARCPRHGWEFDIRTGETVFGIDKRRRARTFSVTVDSDDVVVELRRPQRSAQAASA